MSTEHVVAEFMLNGRPIVVSENQAEPLSTFLRRAGGCSSIHVGCAEGVCGACTVLIDGASVRSCLSVVGQVHGSVVTTAEGAGAIPAGKCLQEALIENHAAQCGYCTCGVLMVGMELVAESTQGELPGESEIRRRLSSVVCRCTGYEAIVAAIIQALKITHEMDGK